MQKETEHYKLISGKDDEEFCASVNKLLADGYELYGSPALAFNGEHMVVAQALVKAVPQLV